MDPNATLDSIRSLLAAILSRREVDSQDALDLAEYVEALDNWLTRDGFLPDEWIASSRQGQDQIEEVARELAGALEEFMSADPDMTSYEDTEHRLEKALERAKAIGLAPKDE